MGKSQNFQQTAEIYIDALGPQDWQLQHKTTMAGIKSTKGNNDNKFKVTSDHRCYNKRTRKTLVREKETGLNIILHREPVVKCGGGFRRVKLFTTPPFFLNILFLNIIYFTFTLTIALNS